MIFRTILNHAVSIFNQLPLFGTKPGDFGIIQGQRTDRRVCGGTLGPGSRHGSFGSALHSSQRPVNAFLSFLEGQSVHSALMHNRRSPFAQ